MILYMSEYYDCYMSYLCYHWLPWKHYGTCPDTVSILHCGVESGIQTVSIYILEIGRAHV